MGDLLIRNIPDDLRRGLANTAKQADQSLSDAATNAIRLGLIVMKDASVRPKVSLFDAIRLAIGDNLPTEEESRIYQEILDDARKAPDRKVPNFE